MIREGSKAGGEGGVKKIKEASPLEATERAVLTGQFFWGSSPYPGGARPQAEKNGLGKRGRASETGRRKKHLVLCHLETWGEISSGGG